MSNPLLHEIRSWGIHTQFNAFVYSARRFQTSAKTPPSSQKETGNPFPYPTHRNPTPHQLFHLPHNATESDIKARYYDLVRLYHPDKVGASATPDLAHARFQAIKAAYDILRGKSLINNDGRGAPSSLAPRYQSTAAYRAMRRKRQELYNSGPVDDSRKDKLILFGVVVTVVFVMLQTASVRREVLFEAMSRHRQAADPSRQYQKSQEEDRLSQDTVEPSKTS
ncbi:DnaJ-domain-containing protein [Pholiota conissans]|uniref:DnaJ-domain-containing protein n=1 Tax=Pholiota conissans TaxID=109636 RepID=A0A9P5Z150_9AGAR|nr:DnaJ-domain-containing protein [Pholiota conissans]